MFDEILHGITERLSDEQESLAGHSELSTMESDESTNALLFIVADVVRRRELVVLDFTEAFATIFECEKRNTGQTLAVLQADVSVMFEYTEMTVRRTKTIFIYTYTYTYT